jgi:AraC family ethanolamine operon transcriptional activator
VLQKQSPLLATPSSYKHRKQVVDRVVLYLESHKDRPVRIAELCAAVGASRRTLQYSFESIVGISPVQYVRAIRLNGARRCLQSADEKTTVADVAAAWGFFHLSQFAKDYRELFGERPSDTRVI